MLKKRNLLFLSLLILGILLLSSCFLNPPVTEGILKGQVMVPEGTVQTKDLTGQALPDATVNIIDLTTGAIIATTVTDANGYYQVSVPPGGPYLLEAVKGGVKLEQITCPVEVGIEYDLGTADCVSTSAALIAQAMMDAGDNPADIDCAAIIADPNFDDVSSIVCSTIQAGQDPTASTVIEEAVEDFLNPPTPTPIPTPAPIPLTAIGAITGTAQVGVKLTAGALTPAGATADYQWQICATVDGTYTNITGATSTTYTPVADDVTKFIKVVATGTGGYSGTVTSTATLEVEISPITAIGAITGTAQVGVELTAGALTPAGATATYQWQICATSDGTYTNITGATSTTYTPVADDVTKFIKVVATGTGGYSGTVTSAATAAVVATGALVIGDSYGGGIVAYILQNGDLDYDAAVQHGLIAATADAISTMAWSNIIDESVGITGTAIGTGQANTTLIVEQTDGTTQCTSGAAYYCDNLIEGGDSDWFLPSQDELNELYLNQVAIGGFAEYYYWSSSEDDADDAWYQYFTNGSQYPYYGKDLTSRVRAVRAF